LIYPTRLAVIAAAAGAPIALAVAAAMPGNWFLTLAWPLAILLLCAFDANRSAGRASARIDFPQHAYVGEKRECRVSVDISCPSAPRSAHVAIATSPRTWAEDDGRARIQLQEGRGAIDVPLQMLRRGVARFERLWVRWTGPLGLIWQQGNIAMAEAFPILPDLRPVHDRGAAIINRFALEGLIAQLTRGQGSDFDALVEYRPGMDRRSIDWKQSGRHGKLLSKQYRSERNNQIVFAIDSGRQMSEPVAGLPRVDRCVSAALLAAWIGLKLGDRVALTAFDSKPRLASGFASGSGAFAELERAAAQIDYSVEETNYTYALTTLSARLSRRSMIILFTEITDTISAEFLVRAIRRLVETHLLLVVVLRDQELEAFANREPEDADDVTRAITAASLLKERQVVITTLRHLGVHVIEAEFDRVNEQLVAGYLDLKRRNLL
jgi:uncharacterized protein (DUF58 family)